MNTRNINLFLFKYWLSFFKRKKDLEKYNSDYKFYIEHVSSGDMASSLEVGHFICELSRTFDKKNVLDLGSGLSSFILRKHSQDHPGVSVTSIDDDLAWLNKTRSFLNSKKLDTDQLFYWDDFKPKKQKYDLIFYDLGSMETRKNNFQFVLDNFLSESGFFVIDDIHKTDYKSYVKNITSKREDLIFHDLRYLTKDSYKRYSGLIYYR